LRRRPLLALNVKGQSEMQMNCHQFLISILCSFWTNSHRDTRTDADTAIRIYGSDGRMGEGY